jgi:small subunit ribosomal protein S1
MLAQTSTNPNPVSENSFAALFEESLSRQEMRIGEVITAEVISVDPNVVIVNAGLKSESTIATEEFKDDRGEIEVKVGDFVSVAIEALEDGFGATKLSRDKAKKLAAWTSLDDALAGGLIIKGVVSGKVKGGLTVMVNGIRAFLPGLARGPASRQGHLALRRQGARVQGHQARPQAQQRRGLAPRRHGRDRRRGAPAAPRDAEGRRRREGRREEHHRLRRVRGPGRHRWPAAHHRPRLAPREAPDGSPVGRRRVTAKILKFDAEKNRVSLGLKQLGEDPWIGISRRYPQGTRLFGKVTNITDYGAFVEIESGIEGLVHVSEMDWTNKNVHPAKVVSLGDEVEVMILEIDEDRRRISLGMKQCMPNPWEEFAMNHKKGDKVKGVIKSITDFGVFIGLPGNIDGLVHLSDLSWQAPARRRSRRSRRATRSRPWCCRSTSSASASRSASSSSRATRSTTTSPPTTRAPSSRHGEVDRAKGAVIELEKDVEGYLRASEISRDRVEDVRSHLKEGDELEMVIVNIDRKSRSINLSIKQKDAAEEAAALQKHTSESNSASAGTTNLGALLKAKLGGSKDKE